MDYILGHLPGYIWAFALIGGFLAFGGECASLHEGQEDDHE